jgi:hypothetical protein
LNCPAKPYLFRIMSLRFWNVSVFGAVGMVRTMRLGEGVYTVGTDPACEIVAQGEGLESRHALLHLSGEGIAVEDLGSAAGTRVGGARVQGICKTECPGLVEVGSIRLEVEFAGAWADDGLSPEQTLRLVHPTSDRAFNPRQQFESTQRIAVDALLPTTAAATSAGGETMAYRMPVAEAFFGGSLPVSLEYGLEGEIARGGMGRIYSAQDPNLERHVAIKVSGARNPAVQAQFCHEARVLAHLAHPNIVPVYNLGRDAEGRSFYSMKLVQGRTLREVLRLLDAGDQETISHFTRARLLRVFRKVCDAMAFAHDRGFLHRDLKPENIMVGEFGEVLVMDWGLAKALPGHGAPAEEPAYPGFIEGTPQYMSPEQAEGQYAGLDERSDIYSLGGILYSILTLRPPVEGVSVDEVIEKVKNGQTTKILQRAGVVGLQAGGPGRMKSGIPDALRAVTQKAMSRDRERRYTSVQELARDLESFQSGFATTAEEAGVARLAVLLVKRHKVLAAMLALMLAGAGVFTVRLAKSERQARALARDARTQAAIASANAVRAAENAERAEKQAHIAAENERIALEEREESRVASASANIAVAEAAEQFYNADAMRRALREVPVGLRDQTWRYLHRLADSSERTLEEPAGSYTNAWQVLPDYPDVLWSLRGDSYFRNAVLMETSVSSGASREVVHLGNGLWSVLAVAPDAKRVAVVRYIREATENKSKYSVELWSLESSQKQLEIPFSRDTCPTVLTFSSDGRFLLAHNTRFLSVIDSAAGRLCWDMSVPHGLSADFLKKPGQIAVYFGAKWVMHFAAGDGTVLKEAVRAFGARGFSHYQLGKCAAAPDWSALYTIGRDVCRKVELSEGRVEYEIRLPTGAVNGVKLLHLAERKMVATLGSVSDSTAVLQLWNDSDGTFVRAYPVEMPRVQGADWSLLFQAGEGTSADRLLVGRGGATKVFAIPKARMETVIGQVEPPPVHGFVFLDEPWKVLRQERRSGPAQPVACEILDTRRTPPEVVFHYDTTTSHLFFPSTSRDGKRLVISRMRETEARVFRVSGNQLTDPVSLSLPNVDCQPQMSPDGELIWFHDAVYSTVSAGGLTKLDRTGLTPLYYRIPARWVDNDHVVEVAMLSDGAGTKDPSLRSRCLVLWDAKSGARIHSLAAPEANAVSVSPDGTRIAEAGADMKVRIRDAETLEVVQTLRVHDGPAQDVAWHPKRPVLATCSDDFSVRIWDLNAMDLIEEFGIFSSAPGRLSWSPDGSRLSVQCSSGEIGLFSPDLSKLR